MGTQQATRTDNTQAVSLTPEAAEAVESLFAKRELDAEQYALRVFVQDGGCSGYQYGMALDKNLREDDRAFESEGVRVVIDGHSLQYLNGSTIDYHEDVMNAGFKIENPNAVSSCGCGDSFRTESRRNPRAKKKSSCGCK